MSDRRRRAALGVVLAVALVWRMAFLVSIHDTPLARMHEWPESDMATFVEQARRIADGDWLAQSPHYPYHLWMQPVPLEVWETWRPAGMFYQPPLYSYGLASLMAFGTDVAAGARWVQLLLGVWGAGLMFGIGAFIFGTRTGLLAGLVVALYGPLMMSESQVLRDGPIVFWILLILWLAVEALEGARKGRLTAGELRWRAWLIGMLLGVQMMLHEAALFLGLAVLLMGVAGRRKEHGVRKLRARGSMEWVFLIIAGMVVGYAPMLARNIAVGAPLGPRYFGSAQAFAAANHPDNNDTMISNWVPENPERFVALMSEAKGSPTKIVVGVARQWGGEWPRWLKRWGLRILTLCMGHEVTENLAYDYFKRRAPILSLAIDFRWVLPLAVAGAVALGRRRWRAKLRGGLGLVLLQSALTFGLVSMVYPFGRYRLMFLPLLALLVAYAVTRIWLAFRKLRWKRVCLLTGFAGIMALAQYGQGKISPFMIYQVPRGAEYLLVSREYTREGRLEAAILELEDGLEVAPWNRQIAAELAMTRGMAFQAARRYPAAVEQYREALRLAPENSLAKLGLDRALRGQPLERETE